MAQTSPICFLVRLRCAKKHFPASGVCERSECMERPQNLFRAPEGGSYTKKSLEALTCAQSMAEENRNAYVTP